MAKVVKATPGEKTGVDSAAQVLKDQAGKAQAGTATKQDPPPPPPDEGKGSGTANSNGGNDNAQAGTGNKQNQDGPGPGVITLPTGVPTSEQIEDAAQHIATNPEMFIAWQQVGARAQQIIELRDQPAPLSVSEMAATNYQRLVSKYGKDFVTAKRGTNQQYFTRAAWSAMGKNKQGWEEVTATMPEVTAEQL